MDADIPSRVEPRMPERKSGRTRVLLAAMLTAFIVGGGLAAYAVTSGLFSSVSDDVSLMGDGTAAGKVPLISPLAGSAAQQAAAVEQGGLESRVVGMEQRLTQLDLKSQASAGNAARAEGLLIAFAARRAVERGAQLGYLEDQLNLRFGAAEPAAVRDLVRAAQNPITVEQLTARLDDLSPILAKEAEDGVGWSWFQRELGELFIVRRESAPSPLPEDRLARARLRLQSGMIDSAIAEVQNLPGAQGAAGKAWINDAERYSRAVKALDRIERAAILEPRQLRDASGRNVEQPSPVTGTNP